MIPQYYVTNIILNEMDHDQKPLLVTRITSILKIQRSSWWSSGLDK